MQMITFPGTDITASRLGMGCMRLPVDGDKIDRPAAIKLIRDAIDNGVTYIDTAYGYHNRESEIVVGEALKDGYRERVTLVTKLPVWLVEKPEDMEKLLDEQLEKLQTDHVDFYLLHALSWGSYEKVRNMGAREFLDRMIEKGKIRYPAFSFHDDAEAFRKIITDYPWKMAQVQHNIAPEPETIPSAQSDDGKTHFLFLGEIGKRKGVFDIIRAIAGHRNEADGKMELKIGGNRNEEELISAIKSNSLEDIVSFEGWVSGEKKVRLLNWADVYILPSFNEGLPISILEAMSYGCPIISTPVGGIPEVVTDNGILVAPGNAEEIWNAMYRYICNPALIEKEGQISLMNVKPYMPDSVISDLNGIYLNILEARR